MARTKSTPVRREPSSSWTDYRVVTDDHLNGRTPEKSQKISDRPVKVNGYIPKPSQALDVTPAGIPQLITCVLGIYISFLTWALLQERITTTDYSGESFVYSIFLNTIQSAFATVVGSTYLYLSNRGSSQGTPPVFPSAAILPPLLLAAITSSLASPFGYASLKYVGYITFILAKSCKLVPLMALHVSIFRKRYPLYKYAVVALVTAGVALFTISHPGTAKKASKGAPLDNGAGANRAWGLFLLSINLLFDGLTNSTQDHINATFKPYSGSQMMVANNLISTVLTSVYLLAAPYAAPFLRLAGVPLGDAAALELTSALAFVNRHPRVLYDVLGFSACGAVGQIFIFYTLSKFSSLLLVTITVTRKMLTMLLSVIWFGHKLTPGQWLGVGLVFGGVGAEAEVSRREKAKKTRVAKEAKKSNHVD